MSTFAPHVESTVAAIAAATGVDVKLHDDTLTIDGQPLVLPQRANRPDLTGSYADLLGIAGLLPTVPQGDDRDRLLWRIVAEARSEDPAVTDTALPLDVDLAKELPSKLAFSDPDASSAIADAIEDRFFSQKRTRVLKPIHSSLPLNYAHGTNTGRHARWRMFSAEILVFLLYDETTGSSDIELATRLLDFFENTDDLTAIDRLFLRVAKEGGDYPDASPESSALMNKYEAKTVKAVTRGGGIFCAPSLALFRADLRTVLDTTLPKPDKVQWLTLLLSLHIAVRMYRLALVKGNELNLALAAAAGAAPPSSARSCACTSADEPPTAMADRCLTRCPLAGAIKFRTGAGRYRPVSRRDPCYDSYTTLDQRTLLALPAVLVTTNLALRAWTAVGGPPHESSSASALATAMSSDPALTKKINAASAALAVLVHADWRAKADSPHLKETAGIGDNGIEVPGLVALRDSVLRQRRTSLRHQSRDVVNQLMLDINAASGGSLVSRNGTHTFFEIDERLLLLLVRLTCAEPAPYDVFLNRLTQYGLAPQHAQERVVLADALERLGLLVRYSDAGEASFVHYR